MNANPPNFLNHIESSDVSVREQSTTELSEEQRHWLLYGLNATDVACDTSRCIHWLFEEQARCSPNALAVSDGCCSISYAELNARANQVAEHLSRGRIGPGLVVGICMARSIDLIVSLLGILKCGAAYVPIESDWPYERLRYAALALGLEAFVVDSAQVERLIRLRKEVPALAEITCISQGKVIDIGSQIDSDSSDGSRWRTGIFNKNSSNHGSPDDLAYIIFTSGSTGQPKGVAVRHRPVVNLIDWVNRTFAVGQADRILFATSIAFDLSVYDVFGILASGGAIRIALDDEVQDPACLADILVSEQITFWDSAPAALERLAPFFQRHSDSTLRLVFLSGDWIPLSLPSAVQSAFPGAKVVALGGATEATVWSNFYQVETIDPAWNSIPYGRPIQNARYYILDHEMRPCPIGVSGDLYIGGLCLASGYAGDAELTASKFLPSPFVDGERIYRTGDRARFFPDGNIEFLGRADRQIKVRGFRVEPGEIEAQLERHPAVRCALVVSGDKKGATKRLLAYVVACSGVSPTAGELRGHLLQSLPRYMVPAQFVILPELPLTTNGKVDRSAIQILAAERAPTEENRPGEISQPTPVEQTLMGLWHRILKVDHIGLNDSFFDLGGDSLQTVELIVAAAGAGLNIRMKQLLEHPTIAGLAALVEHGTSVHNVDYVGDVPLTPTQCWFFERNFRVPETYNAVFVFEVTKPVNSGLLEEALRRLCLHHDALRLRFTNIDGRWRQSVVSTAQDPEVAVSDLSAMDDGRQQSELLRIVREMRISLDSAHGVLMKLTLFRLGPGAADRLILVVHHLAFDAFSLRILLEDLASAYGQLDQLQSVCLVASSSFANWATRLAEYAHSDDLLAEADYWLSLPWDAVKRLPCDFSQGCNRYGSSRTVQHRLSARQTRSLLSERPEQLHASAATILLAVLAQTLAKWSGDSTVLIDVTDHGRRELFEDVSLSRTIGYLTVNVPLLVTIPQRASIAQAVAQVRHLLQHIPHGGVGFGVLRYLACNDQRGQQLRVFPSPEVKFNYLGALTTQGMTQELLRPIPAEFPGVIDQDEQRAYLHNLELSIIDDCLEIVWKFSTDVHRPETIESLLECYIQALQNPLQSHGTTDESDDLLEPQGEGAVNLLGMFLRRSKQWLAITILAGLISGAATTLLIVLVNQMIHLRDHYPRWLVLSFVALCVMRLGAGLAFHGLLVRLSQNAIHDLRLEICHEILAAPLRQLEAVGITRLTSAFADDMLHVATAVINLPYVFVNVIILGGCFLYLGWISWGMMLGMGPCLLAGALTYVVATRWANHRLRQARHEQDRLFHHFRKLVLGAKELKLSGTRRSAFLQEALGPSVHAVRRHNIVGITVYSAAANWSRLLFFIYVGVMLLWAGKGFTDVAGLAGCVIVILYMMAPLEAILNAMPYLAQAEVALGKVQALALSLESEPSGLAERAASLNGWHELELIDVGYVYRDHAEAHNFTLGPVSLTLQPAQVTFIVGGNGSGKTTLGKLIAGLYPAHGGIVLLDGQGIEMVGREAYRSMFAAVFNDFCLFDSLLGVNRERMPVADGYLRQMDLQRKVQIVQGRFSTTDLSQGQRKRLALVAALLEDRSIYLFDEWAADQDPEFKQQFYWRIIPQLKARGKAVVVITHDDRYFDIADQLIKLEDGKSAASAAESDLGLNAEIPLESVIDSRDLADLPEGLK